MVTLNKASTLITVFMSIAIPAITAFASYQSAIQTIKEKIAQNQLDAETNYARKEDIREMLHKLDQISERLSRIEGSLERSSREPSK